jgi:hypothetical protein
MRGSGREGGVGRLERGRGERKSEREGWVGWLEREGGRGKRERGADGKVGLGYLGLGGFLLYFFLDSIKPVRFGLVQLVLSFLNRNRTGPDGFFIF